MKKHLGWARALGTGLVLLALLPACPVRLLPTWFTHIGGAADDGARAIASTQDGGFVVAGFTEADAEADDNALLVKVGAGGNVLWRVEYGDEREDTALAVAAAQDGGFVVAGRFGGEMDATSDGFLIKTDKRGKEEWRHVFDSEGQDSAVSVEATSDGGYLVGLQYDMLGECRATMVKTSASGAPLWQVDAGEATHIARATVTSSGYGLGWWEVDAADAKTAAHGRVGILSVDSAGGELWRKTYVSDTVAEVEDLRATPDGGFILAGESDLFSGDSHTLLWKVDAAGELEWQQNFGRGQRDKAHSVRVLSDGGYIVAGSLQPSADRADMTLTKTDAQGNALWERGYGGDDADIACDVVELKAGFALAGIGESFEKEGEADHKQMVVLKTDIHGHCRRGEVDLPEPPGVEPEHYEMLSFMGASHTITPVEGKPDEFTIALVGVADIVTAHRVGALPTGPNGLPDTVSRTRTLAPVEEFVGHWDDYGFNANPPEAALVMTYSGTDPQLMFFRLANPRYEAAQDRLLFDGTHIEHPTARELVLVDEGRIVETTKDFSTYLFISEGVGARAVTDQTFEYEVMESDIPVVVLFWAEWNGPSRQLLQVFEEVAKEYGGVKLCKMDVDENPLWSSEMNIKSIPTLVTVYNGSVIDRKVGVMSKAKLEDMVLSALMRYLSEN